MTALAEPDLRVRTVDVEIVVPVFNEETDLEPSVRRLHAFLRMSFPFDAVITIADNASTDGTWQRAIHLADELDGVRAVHLDARGRGRALQHVWTASTARVVAYMDVDLSTDLAALLPLVAPLLSGHSDVAIGSRLSRTARVVRGPRREFVSRGYNMILRTTLRTRRRGIVQLDLVLGRRPLHREERRRHDRLRPHGQETVVIMQKWLPE